MKRIYQLTANHPATRDGNFGAVRTVDLETVTEIEGGLRVDTRVTGVVEGRRVDPQPHRVLPRRDAREGARVAPRARIHGGLVRPAKNPLPESLTPGGDVGYIVRNTRTSGFKLAIIVGYSAYKTRVRFWRAASKCWTQPTYVERTYLQALTDDEKRERAKLIAVAQRAARNFCPGAYL